MALVTSCVPYFYEGKAAILNESSGFKVTRKDRSWGDCYFKLKRMPTVYQQNTERYTIKVTQGARYWPEFFLEVISSEGVELGLSGEYIEKISNYNNLRGLREARRTDPTHKTVRLTEVPNRVVDVDVIDNSGEPIGEHLLIFTLLDVKCFDWDGV